MNRRKSGLPCLLFALALIISPLTADAQGGKKIGLLMWSDATIYVDAKRGVLDQLGKEGFAEPVVRFTMKNAGASKVKAAKTAKKFVADRMDLVIVLGTSATLVVAGEIKDAPVVFGMVYDPVEVGIARDWKSSRNNTTGASNWFPMSNLLKILKDLAPVKTLAVLYTPNEKNSEAQLRELRKDQAAAGVRVMAVPLAKKEDVPLVLPEVLREADAVYLGGSSVVLASAPVIVQMATRARVLTVTHLDENSEKGALLGVTADSYAVGRLAGEKAARVLRGAKPASLPIGTLKKNEVILNMRTARAGRFPIPPAFMKSVTRVIE